MGLSSLSNGNKTVTFTIKTSSPGRATFKTGGAQGSASCRISSIKGHERDTTHPIGYNAPAITLF